MNQVLPSAQTDLRASSSRHQTCLSACVHVPACCEGALISSLFYDGSRTGPAPPSERPDRNWAQAPMAYYVFPEPYSTSSCSLGGRHMHVARRYSLRRGRRAHRAQEVHEPLLALSQVSVPSLRSLRFGPFANFGPFVKVFRKIQPRSSPSDSFS